MKEAMDGDMSSCMAVPAYIRVRKLHVVIRFLGPSGMCGHV